MSPKNKGSLYFVALVPPKPILNKVERIKKQLSEHYNTRGALKSPAHITLHMPFDLSEEREGQLCKALNLVKLSKSFIIEQSGYGSFTRKVIYIEVSENENLRLLHDLVSSALRRNLHVLKDTPHNRGFTPHMTVAFRDLKPAMFEKAWSSLYSCKIYFKWECLSFHLLKHNGKKWEIFKEFSIT